MEIKPGVIEKSLTFYSRPPSRFRLIIKCKYLSSNSVTNNKNIKTNTNKTNTTNKDNKIYSTNEEEMDYEFKLKFIEITEYKPLERFLVLLFRFFGCVQVTGEFKKISHSINIIELIEECKKLSLEFDKVLTYVVHDSLVYVMVDNIFLVKLNKNLN